MCRSPPRHLTYTLPLGRPSYPDCRTVYLDTTALCYAENPVSKLASVRPARLPQFPNLTVSLDAQESTLYQENFLLRRQVGPSVLGIVIAIGRRASDSLTARKEACIIVWCHHHCRGLKQTSEKITNILRFSHPRKALLFAFKSSHLTLRSLQSVQRADPA